MCNIFLSYDTEEGQQWTFYPLIIEPSTHGSASIFILEGSMAGYVGVNNHEVE